MARDTVVVVSTGVLSHQLPPPPPPTERRPEEWSGVVEKTRDQTTLSLTERLRREFGLDTTSESDEDAGDKG